MITEYLITAALVALIIFLFKDRKTHTNLPPGPKGWPVIGTLPDKGGSSVKFFTDMRDQYGDIFSVRIGSRLLIGLMRYDIIKEAFAKPQLQGRPDLYTLRMSTKFTNSGLVFSSGTPWQNSRRFAIRHLKDLGMGKSSMEDIIQEEAKGLIGHFEKHLGEPVKVTHNVNVAVLNVIWRLVAGERYDLADKDIANLTNKVEDNIKLVLGPLNVLDWFPWIMDIMPDFCLNYFFRTHQARDNINSLEEFLTRLIKKHQQTLDPNNIRDYIDHYLVEMEAQKDNPASTFSQSMIDLVITILDLYFAGSETTSSTLRWFILYMAVYPEVQRRVQRELDDVVPNNRLTELTDKLPYFDATVAEVNRHMSLSPMAVPHSATEDTTLAGYTIPKDAILMAYLKGCLHDPSLWDAPEEFRPERFLDADGKFTTKEGYVPFSTGRRQCLGESLAKMELFLFGSSLLKTFTISAPEGVALNTTHDEPGYKEAVINLAKPYEVVITKRIV